MAGFDFSIRKHPTGEELQRALLRWTHGTARDLHLDFRYRSEGGEFVGTLNGSLPVMYALEAYLVQDLPTLAAAYASPRDRRQRIRLAHGLLDAFDKGLQQITEMVHRIGHDFGGVPSSIVFDYGANTHLAGPLRSLTNTLILDIQGTVSRKTAVEEVHTGLELLLRDALGRRARGLSFAQMVDVVRDDGVIDVTEADDVKALKDIRREAKHRGKGFDEDRAEHLIVESVGVLQKLLVVTRAS